MRMIFLLIVLALLGLVIYRMWSIRRQKQTPKPRLKTTKTLRCDYCGVHFPENEAVFHQQKTFCSMEHKQAFLEES